MTIPRYFKNTFIQIKMQSSRLDFWKDKSCAAIFSVNCKLLNVELKKNEIKFDLGCCICKL